MQHLQKPRGEGVPSQVLEDLRELAARSRFLTQVLSFHTLAHSFALTKNSTLLFSSDSALFAQNNRGWGIPVTHQPPQFAFSPSPPNNKPVPRAFRPEAFLFSRFRHA